MGVHFYMLDMTVEPLKVRLPLVHRLCFDTYPQAKDSPPATSLPFQAALHDHLG